MIQNEIIEESEATGAAKKFFPPSKEISIYTIKLKLKKNELNLEDALLCNDCINDLIANNKSKFKTILTSANIEKLISFCLDPGGIKYDNSGDMLRYPYFSCELLCSINILNFKYSIKGIKEANIVEKLNKQRGDKKEIENDKNVEKELIEEEKSEENDDLGGEKVNQKDLERPNYLDLMNKEDINEEKYMDFQKYEESFTEIHKEEIENDKNFQYEKEDIALIDEFLDKIFKFLNLNLSNYDSTYIGYFQKIVNYLLIKESKITIQYLLTNKDNIFNKFYLHMNNASIQNILENILNFLYDYEDNNDANSVFNIIIKDLIDVIDKLIEKQYDNNYDKNIYYKDKNKIEFICELIINTLVNSAHKNFIFLVLPLYNINNNNENNNIIIKIKNLIQKAVYLKLKMNNNKKYLIINLLELLVTINSVIMNSKKNLNNNYNEDMSFFNNLNTKKIKTFEFQYFCQKSINFNTNEIFKAFEENNKLKNSYLSITKEIYNLIKNDIIEIYNNDAKITLMLIHEWKYILSCLKLFIFQFYAIENFKLPDNTNDFCDEKLFDLSIYLFFDSNNNKNNFYQNIFIDIIKLLNYHKTPKNLINFFIQKQHLFIENILKIINEEDKYNIFLGLDIQILLYFYNSSNPAVVNFYDDLKKEKLENLSIKNLHLLNKFMFLIKPNFERKLNEKNIYTELEIFSDDNDIRDSFDGNDVENNNLIRLDSLKSIIKKYIDYVNLLFINKMSKNDHNKFSTSNNQTQTKTTSIKGKFTSGEEGKKTTIKEVVETKKDSQGQIGREIKFEIDEDKNEKKNK